ncbi:MAG: type II toxin-antitoxin system RelE/ParE family toxin [Oscillospiraceae bacterium]
MEKYKILVSQKAQQDLRALFFYIKDQLNTPLGAANIIDKIEAAFLSLETMPERHEIIKSALFYNTEIRKFVIEKHIVFYTVDKQSKTVNIIRVLHSRRSWQSLL